MMIVKERCIVWLCRSACVLFVFALHALEPPLQAAVDATWRHLLANPIYNHVTFETAWTVLMNVPISFTFFLLTTIPSLHRYKLDPHTPGWKHVGVKNVLIESIQYATPFLIMDFLTVKKYSGVDPEEWAWRRRSWIQSTRALPTHAPSVFAICYQLLGAFVLFDIFFCFIHFALHRNAWLYNHIHARHHDHNPMTSKVVNQLSLAERILLILSANEALKLVSAHPLTRNLFVPLFLVALTENHCGYDLPWSMDKVVPWGVLGGARRHWEHHERGARHYAPFSTVIDDYILGTTSKTKKS